VKRIRSEDEAETNTSTPRQEAAKRPRLDTQFEVEDGSGRLDAEGKGSGQADNEVAGAATLDKQVAMPTAAESMLTPVSTILPSFVPKLPLGPAPFELSSYSKGPISWKCDSEEALKLYYDEDKRMLGTVDGPLSISISPAVLGEFSRKELPDTKGNSAITLLSKGKDEDEVRLVFDRAKGSKVEIGKIQVRSFIRWLRQVNPAIHLLGG
jgi:hypothetical protein